MSSQLEDTVDIEDYLQDALDAAENKQAKYHIREALQVTKITD